MDNDATLLKIRRRLKFIEENFSDEEIFDIIEEVQQKVLNYINQKSVPAGLSYIIINMCVDYLRYINQVNVSSDPDAEVDVNPGSVASISIGDTSIGLGTGDTESLEKTILKSHTADLDAFIFNYKEQLNAYRRMRW